jgi:BirA family transcriptional regulator, biotin operon repressor / biotin---[acetyl-CoA-carboxylase] ligase
MNARLIIYPEVESTQDTARELVLSGEAEGTAVMALKQTRGRGRSGHSWVSPSGKNLALSLILRPTVAPADAALLGLLASIAVAEAVEAMGVEQAQLKWPNDVWVHEKKIAGILPEANLTAKSVNFVIIGVGLNVNTEINDFPFDLRQSITSVFLETGQRRDLEETALLLLEKIDASYARVAQEGCGFVPGLWQTRWAHEGARIIVQGVEGVAVGIAPDGALIIETMDGNLTRVNSGEAIPVKPHPR